MTRIVLGASPSLREIAQFAFNHSGLTSFYVPSSVITIDWTCFRPGPVEVTFEAPARVRQIVDFSPGSGVEFAMPDSVEVLTVSAARECGFVCQFGLNSQLRELWEGEVTRVGAGFLRLTEASLKRIRPTREWMEELIVE
jgi:hypothetical protein